MPFTRRLRRQLAGVTSAALGGVLLTGLLSAPQSAAQPPPPPPGGAPTPPVGMAPILEPIPLPALPLVPGVPPMRPLPPIELPTPPPFNVVPTLPLLPVPGPPNVQVVASGLEIPWDIGFLPDGTALVADRSKKIRLLTNPGQPGAAVIDVDADLSDVTVFGDGGLSGLAISPDFATTGRFYTCIDSVADGQPGDLRMVAWQFSRDGSTANPVLEPIIDRVTKLIQQPDADALTDKLPGAGPGPIATRIGRPVFIGPKLGGAILHLDCRPRFGPDGMIYVGVGDVGSPTNAQDLGNLGGKILRIDPRTGGPAPGNPFLNSPNPQTRLIYTYGHRNPQGLAFQAGTGRVYAGEHGPDRDDEVNVLVPGGNYGWDPSSGGDVIGTTEGADLEGNGTPMTDLARFPKAVQAVWSSGTPTVAPSDIEFLTDPRWGPRRGMLAVATLKGSNLLLMRLAPNGTVTEVQKLAELDQTYGRLRTVETGPDGALYVTTSNGYDDKVLRIAPY